MQKKLFLLDAYALIFRAYYALVRSPRNTSYGKNTNAQFGFTNTLLDLIKNHQPTHMAICFDTSAPTERHIDYIEYKANRQETPEDIRAAVPDIKKIIEAFNIPIISMDGYEADDVIGTLSKQAEKEGYTVFMVTPDKDYGQLVSDKIKIFKPGYQGGDVEILGPEEVCAKWNIKHVSQVIDILGLMGDAVDNIPGIAGVGEKTAAKLLEEYQTLENVLENALLIKGKLSEKIIAGKNNALLSKKLATIITSVPVSFNEESFKLIPENKIALQKILDELEFKTLSKRLFNETAFTESTQNQVTQIIDNKPIQIDLFGNIVEPEIKPVDDTLQNNPILFTDLKNISNTNHFYETVIGIDEIIALVNKLKLANEISFDTETTGIDANEAELVGLSFCIEAGKAWYVPCPAEKNKTHEILALFAPLFNNKKIIWIGQNIKYDRLILKWYNFEIQGPVFDTMLAHYVIEPDGKHNMDFLSEKYLQYKTIHIEELIGKKERGKNQLSMRDVEIEKIVEYAAEDADITFQLKNTFEPLVKSNHLNQILNLVEFPLINVLSDIEFEGVKIDTNFLSEYSKELEKDALKAEENVYKLAGVRFNLASPKQLGEVLFDKLKLDPSAKKTKTGQYQTGEDVLLKLAIKGHQITDDILAFRELSKLKSTYVDALPKLINSKTGRVHTNYGQAIAVTGRLASNNPNLQNIPVRTERGKEIRKAFIPKDDKHILISADYSQIELRIVAAISGDKNMCEAFLNNKDIHTATASKVYNIEESEITKEMRYKAKSVNFGIIYGQGAFGLADNLGITRTEAKIIIDNYKREFSGIQKYMDDTINFARENGYVQTLMGRKRWLKDINSANFTVRGFAERNAINSPIQGSAADMIKLAMIKVYETLNKEKMKSKMIMQVHDELVFDALISEKNELKSIIIECMQTAMQLPNQVPVIAQCGEGKNWLAAHE